MPASGAGAPFADSRSGTVAGLLVRDDESPQVRLATRADFCCPGGLNRLAVAIRPLFLFLVSGLQAAPKTPPDTGQQSLRRPAAPVAGQILRQQRAR